jgi:hypothetical protein
MHTRDLVKKIFANEQLYRSSDPKVKEFLAAIDDQPMDCWPEFAVRFRKDYYELFDRVVPPLMHSGDSLIAAVLLHHLDLARPKERALVKKYIQGADERAHEGVLMQAARLGDEELDRELSKKQLTANVRALLAKRQPARKAGAANVTKKKQPSAPKETERSPSRKVRGRSAKSARK